MIKTYYLVAKPGIIMGNLITTTAGFALASRGRFDIFLFLEMFIGLGAVIASACVFNNYVDRVADSKMSRTKMRPLVQGLISGKNALVFASALAFIGFSLLIYFTNPLCSLAAFAGFFIYVVLYSFWKYHNTLATLVGSVAGAIPPVVGYLAVSHSFDWGAALLFLILVLWQMPHFFSIAVYRLDEYTAAGIPTLPSAKGMMATKKQMFVYILLFCFAAALLSYRHAGYVYLFISVISGLSWMVLSWQGFARKDERVWARSMFRLSLVIITLLSLAMSVDAR